MRCEQIEPLIYLWKPGELNEKEQNLLQEHLLSCPECRMLRDEIVHQQSLIADMGNEINTLKDSDYFKNQIFENVRSLQNRAIRNVPTRIKQISLQCLTHPVYRYMSAAIISALVITFLLQNYFVYRHISDLETKFGNPSSYAAAVENKPILVGKEDFSFIKANTRTTGIRTIELNWIRSSRFLLMTMRNHRLIQELASHSPGIDPFELIKIYNNSVLSGGSKINQYKMEEKL